MKRIITIFLITAIVALTQSNFVASAAQTNGYWKLTGTQGNGEYTSPASATSGWSSTESVSGSGATNNQFLNGELIHTDKFTWTNIPDKVFAGEAFSITATGEVAFHKEPWFTKGHLLIQFYGALFPQNMTINGKESGTFNVTAPIGNTDVKSDNHYLYLRFSCKYGGATNNDNPFQYVYEWVPPIAVTSVSVSESTASIIVGKTLQLTATVSPVDAANKAVTWDSSNIKIATVSSAGKVIAKSPGSVTITATTVSGGKKATCKVTVIQPVTSIKLNKNSITLLKGKTFKLIQTINPSNASNKKVTWKSSNKAIATVSSTGTVRGIKKGTSYITVTTVDGKKSAKCKVVVK